MHLAAVVAAIVCFAFHGSILRVDASLGDRTVKFRSCSESCLNRNCTNEKQLRKFIKRQPLAEWVLRWSCEDDCSYHCMWKTVTVFIEEGLEVPQFHGKWPFVRFFGIQEPASVIFSLLNGAAGAVGTWVYITKVHPSNPMYKMSVMFGIVSMNTWVWSTVFHTRDFPLTEKLDYFSATGSVLFSLFYSIYRMSMGLNKYPYKENGKTIRSLVAVFLLAFFILHVSYLSFVKFDYGYNMLATILAGLCNGVAWIYYHWTTRKYFKHQWKVTLAVCYTSALLLLELQDFPPLWWAFDAHSMWHAGTIVFPLFWYSFMIDESRIFQFGEKLE